MVRDLWLMDRDGGNHRTLLACPGMACLEPAWSPDSRWLANEKQGIQSGRRNPGTQDCCVWLLDLEDWEERLLFDQDVPLYAPVRSCFTTFST